MDKYGFGLDGLKTSSKCTKYSAETKLNAVQDHLNHRLTVDNILTEYQIRSATQLRKWVMKYNSHNE